MYGYVGTLEYYPVEGGFFLMEFRRKKNHAQKNTWKAYERC